MRGAFRDVRHLLRAQLLCEGRRSRDGRPCKSRFRRSCIAQANICERDAALAGRLPSPSDANPHDCGTDCGTEPLNPAPNVERGASRAPHLALESPAQQKTPLRGGGALLGLLQGGEICISIYVDRWEVGEPSLCRGRPRGKRGGHMYGARLNQEVFFVPPASVSASESLNSVRTYVRFVCESDHRTPCIGGMAGVRCHFRCTEDRRRARIWSTSCYIPV
jgi:hypothetical protein